MSARTQELVRRRAAKIRAETERLMREAKEIDKTNRRIWEEFVRGR